MQKAKRTVPVRGTSDDTPGPNPLALLAALGVLLLSGCSGGGDGIRNYGGGGGGGEQGEDPGGGGEEGEGEGEGEGEEQPPVSAAFAANPTAGVAPLLVGFTDQSSGSVTSWAWDFGDGNTANVQNPSHLYQTPGLYSVSLTVTGAANEDTAVLTDLVLVQAPIPPPNAGFTCTPIDGESPLTVHFTDRSTGNVNQWFWDFGDGGVSTERHPSYTYDTPGTYTVALTATGQGGYDGFTRLDYITVRAPIPPPTARFTGTPRSGDAPLTVAFTDRSDGSIDTRHWDFGDGSTSNATDPTHVYGTPGTYTVTLSVAGPGGSHVRVRTDYVNVGVPPAPPVAAFSGIPRSGTAPLTVAFTDLSAGDVTSWAWDFGDGGSSTEDDPVHQYTSPGTYAVTLSVQGPGGSDVLTEAGYVQVDAPPPPPSAHFGASPTSGEAPLTVAFQDASTGSITSWSWQFGDGTGSALANPTHVYSQPGTYTVTLTVAGPGGTDTRTRANLITVDAPTPPPVSDFTGTPRSGEAPLEVQFTDLSTGAVDSWTWFFGDGSTSSARNPSHTYQSPGTYTVRLRVTGPGGSDLRRKDGYVTVAAPPAPTATFDATPRGGGAPLVVTFTDHSTGPVSSWSWDFGDGTTSNQQHPTHTYTSVGAYDVTLTVTGPGGTDSRTRPGLIRVIAPPVAGFTGNPLDGDAPLNVQFSDFSTGAIDSYSWTFGDGTTSGQNAPSHVYQDPGTYTVSLTVTGPGGSDTFTHSNYVTVHVPPPAPVASFGADPTTGVAPLVVDFLDQSTGNVTSWAWDFGDGNTSNQEHPTHTYQAPGSYTVTLAVTGPGGSDAVTQVDFIVVDPPPPPPLAAFAGSPLVGDAPLSVHFNDLTSGDVTQRTWDFGDGSTSGNKNPTHVYQDPGTYTVTLTVTGPGGTDSASVADYVTVNAAIPAPVAEFTGTPTSGDAPLSVSFTDQSTGDVTGWTWIFGDGNGSNLRNPTHTFTSPGTYDVRLQVTGPGGSDLERKDGYVTVTAPPPPPVAAFTGTPTSGDAPLTVAFTDQSTGNVTGWVWLFGDGGSSNARHPSHTYTAPGTYDVQLQVTGPGGADVLQQVGYVTVTQPIPAPMAAFSGTPTSGDAPLTVAFTDQSTGNVTSWSWDFGDGATSTAPNPSHTYTNPGSYDVTLTVTGPGGSDTLTRVDFVTASDPPPPPVGHFNAAPQSGTVPLTVSFGDASTGNVTSWSWDFGDGGSASVPNPSHTYQAAGTYTVSLTVSGPGGSHTRVRADLITVEDVVPPPTAGFVGSPTSGDAPLTVSFTDQSTGQVTSRTWLFGDGASSNQANPSHTYTVPGTYDVQLQVTGPGGSDLHQRNGYVTVQAPPEPPPTSNFTASPGAGVAPLAVSFTELSTGNVTSWSWDFGDGTGGNQPDPSHTYTQAGVYTVSLTVTGPLGSDTLTLPDLITVNDDQSAMCGADNARDNGNGLKVGYDYVPVVPDDSLGFYVVYSPRRPPGEDSGVGNTAGIFIFELAPNEILIFGSGYGDHFVSTYDARFDVDHVNEVVQFCLGFSIPDTIVHFYVPHGHADHVNGEFLQEMVDDGYEIAEITYQKNDAGLVNGVGGWNSYLRSKFVSLQGSTPCNSELAGFASPIGKLWFKWRAQHHTNGAIDLVIDVEDDTSNRVLVRGSGVGGTCGSNPSGTNWRIKAHGTVNVP